MSTRTVTLACKQLGVQNGHLTLSAESPVAHAWQVTPPHAQVPSQLAAAAEAAKAPVLRQLVAAAQAQSIASPLRNGGAARTSRNARSASSGREGLPSAPQQLQHARKARRLPA